MIQGPENPINGRGSPIGTTTTEPVREKRHQSMQVLAFFHWEKAAGLGYNQNSLASCVPGVTQVVICSRQKAGQSVVKLVEENQDQADEQRATNSICEKW